MGWERTPGRTGDELIEDKVRAEGVWAVAGVDKVFSKEERRVN